MIVRMYTINDDPLKLDKSADPAGGTKLEGTLRDAADVLRPVITFKGNVLGYNYMYIPAFGRYYFLSPPTVLRTQLTVYAGRVDVLHSFAAEIRAQHGIPARTADPDAADWYLHDARQPVRAYRSIITRPGVDMAYDAGHYLLITAG